MIDRKAETAEVRSWLAPLEPLRRRVIRVYWTRGLLTLLLLFSAAALGIAAGVASTLWMLRVTGGAAGELVVRIVPLLLAFVAPLAVIALGAAVIVAAIVRGFGRATVLEYEGRFRLEVIAPLLRAAVPGARLEVDGRIDESALAASGLFAPAERAAASGDFLVEGRAGSASFAASTLRVRTRGGRLGRRVSVFRGFFGSVGLANCFDSTILLSAGADSWRGWPGVVGRLQPLSVDDPAFVARFAALAREPEQALRTLDAPVRALLLELASRAGAPLCVSLHSGGLTIAVPGAREPFGARRARPNDPGELTRQADLYALIAEAARALETLSR